MLLRPCADCGEPSAGPRCAEHQLPVLRARRRRYHNPARDTAVARRSRNDAIAAWVRLHGWVCPGDERHQAHRVAQRDLTANHPVPLARGGAIVQPFQVMCRSANSSLGAR